MQRWGILMSMIFDIMKEEHERLIDVIDLYESAIAKEIEGSPRPKRIGNKYYLYFEKRKGPKVSYYYVGNIESEKAIAAYKSLENRKKYQALLKQAKANLKDVKRVFRGKI